MSSANSPHDSGADQQNLTMLDDTYWRQLWRKLIADHKASRLAAALTYRTLFSLVPIIVLSMIIIRAGVDKEDARAWMQEWLHESYGYSLLEGADEANQPDQERFQFGKEVAGQVDKLVARAWDLNLADVGFAGALLLIWAAVALFNELEYAFNDVFGQKKARPLLRRFTNYWAFVTLGPALLFASLYGAERLMEWSAAHSALKVLADVAAGWLMLFLLYVAVPNVRVRLFPAVYGSLLAAILWVAGKWGFRWYVTTAMPYSLLYGSLALAPLFLFWLYANWWIVLFGAEIAAFRQSRLTTDRTTA